ncbi:NAD-P-binding protein [Peniophora sp. CONT]|nr:NAD-P-binding protein [Peniophora sp. CONT]
MSYHSTVKAVGIKETGGLEVIQDLKLPFPEVKPTDLLIKVQYAGVNFIDTYFRSGLYKAPFLPLPISGEVSGVIVELPTDQALLESSTFQSRGFKKGGKVALSYRGSLREYVAVPWDELVVAIPDAVSTRVAAAAFVQGVTTIGQMTDGYSVKKGDTVMIHTVAGGVGLLHAQYAKLNGATVIGTTSTSEKAQLAKEYGADHVILYKSENVVERVLELTGGEGADVVYDGVGKDTFEASLQMTKRKGTLCSFGNASGAVPPFPLMKLTPKNITILRPTAVNWVFTVQEKDTVGKELFGLVASAQLKIHIHGEYPFTAEGVRAAQQDLTAGKTTGKLLIKVADE